MEQSFVKLSLQLDEQNHDFVIGAFDSPAFIGAEQTDNTLILWLDLQKISQSMLEAFIVQRLQQLGYSNVSYTIETVPSLDWFAQWRTQLQPVRIGHNTLIIPHESNNGDRHMSTVQIDNPVTIIIEPRMSFGTGHHETTQLCAELLMESVMPEQNWIDIGTGTGILAILAAKCGAAHILALDNDASAIAEATENALRNGCLEKITFSIADIFTTELPASDGVVANLYNTILEQISGRVASSIKPDGYAILSGILCDQESSVLHAYRESGFILDQRIVRGEWVALRLRRRG